MLVEFIEARDFLSMAIARLDSALKRNPDQAALVAVRDALIEQRRVLGVIVEGS
jgi:hypothetical protein